ncbi:N-terminal domain of NEFA-interacting nuclear protein NIP30-domain-containing protein [Dichotomopilus funicola]|uniref:N-terminal domain of NEFA-interacting nuclear protein NIP30-domain-containing protein n=1 Tax=Dichotomopilus funicola TaxID=1934379 RepID=A0AAN6V755_9PEZI|nr:N-terminal domain of NEFA-interacting nuclear protein NIP30-domain-containing protein [Dichotomopilus funicola]
MSSRFVSAGAIDASTGEPSTAAPPPAETASSNSNPRDPTTDTTTNPPSAKQAAWLAATAQLEADRLRRDQARLQASQSGEKSLYEVLQANKAAKQAAFDEAHRLRNQFRALDDDEVDFLEEVRAKRRREEEEGRREVERGVERFRVAQGNGNGEGGGDGGEEGEGWGFASGGGGGKRRRKVEGGLLGGRKKLKGVGVRRKGSGGGGGGVQVEDGDGGKKGEEKVEEEPQVKGQEKERKVSSTEMKNVVGQVEKATVSTGPTPAEAPNPAPAVATAKPGGLLVDYGSDSDDD